MKLESIIDATEKTQRETTIKSTVKSMISSVSEEIISKKSKEVIERFGKIIEIDGKNVWVDFDGNPMKSPVMAEYDCPHLSIQDLEEVVNSVDVIKIEFKDLALKKPVIKNIYFSIEVVNDIQEIKSYIGNL
ncbi:MAG: hypothetical protein GY714_09825 [Desulfobacterales bacterium]|nr:hypothetical protein [Desulfobacterales bacterium]